GVATAQAEALARECELAVRLALSCVLVPPADGAVARLVREAIRAGHEPGRAT
ncbi:TetR/AcrR family transcriptional regulator, partial [Streptomyces sp. SID14478]|nr:TetR/AcrR family transcriptional regulator [Streptomyces sp. SID14478]